MNAELKLDRRKAIIFGLPLLGLLVGMIGYFALVSPQKAKSHRAEIQLQSLQATLLAEHRLPQKQASVQAVDLFRLVKAMPDTTDMPGIMRDLSRLARQSHVSIQSLQPGAQTTLALGYIAQPIVVTLDGKFGEISRFLARIRGQVRLGEKTLNVTGRLLVPNQVQISTGKTTGAITATLSLDAFVYAAAPPPSATSTDTTATATTSAG